MQGHAWGISFYRAQGFCLTGDQPQHQAAISACSVGWHSLFYGAATWPELSEGCLARLEAVRTTDERRMAPERGACRTVQPLLRPRVSTNCSVRTLLARCASRPPLPHSPPPPQAFNTVRCGEVSAIATTAATHSCSCRHHQCCRRSRHPHSTLSTPFHPIPWWWWFSRDFNDHVCVIQP